MISTAYIGDKKLKNSQAKIINITVQDGKSALAPTWKMAMGLKRGTLTWDEFQEQYNNLIKERMADPKLLAELKELARVGKEEDIILVCFCKKEDQCHRKLAKEILEGL